MQDETFQDSLYSFSNVQEPMNIFTWNLEQVKHSAFRIILGFQYRYTPLLLYVLTIHNNQDCTEQVKSMF